jgi:two-component system, cell cycle response regulator DivK
MRAPLVLVVDDVPDNREMYLEYFRFAGFSVIAAVSGEEAVAKAREARPSVILMDLTMPGIDGWEATRILKSDPATRAIRIIALTGHAEPWSRARAMLVGCDLFLAKPALPADVAAHVIRLLDASGDGAAEGG